MKTICFDDEEQELRRALAVCGEMLQISALAGFADRSEALRYVEENPVDLALLGINTPGTDGLALGRAIREIRPDTAIIFLCAQPDCALDAWELHATGCILKPPDPERLSDELNYAAEWRRKRVGRRHVPHVEVQTFGNFDLIVNGERVSFSRAKAKELLACLVDRKGIRVTREEAFRLLWADGEYSRPKQKMLDVVIRSLRSTLEENGISDILRLERGTLRIMPKALECDMYRLFAGDEQSENAYRGEYMASYTWANQTEGQIDAELERRRALRGGAAGRPL